MKITSLISASASIIVLHFFGMELPSETLRQPPTLKQLAAIAYAPQIDPAHSINNATAALNGGIINQSEVGPFIAQALAQKNQKTLRDILKSQTPLNIQIERFKQYPSNLTTVTNYGFYVCTRHHEDELNPERLYRGMPKLIPDPLTNGSPTKFIKLFSNSSGTKCFDDGNFITQGGTKGICIWDKTTGECVTNGSIIGQKIQEFFPDETKEITEDRLSLFGLSDDDKIAWINFIDNECNAVPCAFNIETHQIAENLPDESISHISLSGKLCAFRTAIRSTREPDKKLIDPTIPDFQIKEISPQDNYVIYAKSPYNVDNPQVLVFATGTVHSLTIDSKPIKLYGNVSQLSSDGSLLAVLHKKNICVLNILTNRLAGKIPATIENEDTLHFFSFSPDNKHLFVLRVDYNNKTPKESAYHLQTFETYTQTCVDEFDTVGIAADNQLYDFTLCNNGDYLLLSNGQLLLQPQGLASHLTPKELLGLLILEHQKAHSTPINPEILALFQQNKAPQIRELIARRYASNLKRTPEATDARETKRFTPEKDK